MPVPPIHQQASPAAALRYSVLRLSRRLRRQAEFGLTPSQISVLTTLGRHGESLVGELTRLEQVSKSSMTRLIAKLEDSGHVSRSIDASDKRGFLVALTARGADVLHAAGTRQDAYLERQVEALTPEERDVLVAALPVLERLLDIRA